jgi:hypothetical protein
MKGDLCGRTKTSGSCSITLPTALSAANRARKAGESEVGIFFVYNGNVPTTGTPWSMAEQYGAYGHDTFWKNL